MPTTLDLEGFRAHLNYQGRDNDPRNPALQLHLDAAIEKVEDYCGPLLPRDVEASVVTDVGGDVLLPWHPIISILSVTNTETGDVNPSGLRLTSGGVLRTGHYRRLLTVRARVGRDPLPASLILATFIIGSHLWETQRGRSGRPDVFTGSENNDVPDVPRGFAVPTRAAELLAAHRQFSIA